MVLNLGGANIDCMHKTLPHAVSRASPFMQHTSHVVPEIVILFHTDLHGVGVLLSGVL